MIVCFCGESRQKIIVDNYEKIILSEDDCLILDITNKSEIIVKSDVLFSDDEPNISYAILLKIDGNNIEFYNSHIKIVKYPNNYYKIYLKKLFIEKNNSENIIASNNILDCDIKIFDTYPQKITFVKNSKIYEKILKFNINEEQLYQLDYIHNWLGEVTMFEAYKYLDNNKKECCVIFNTIGEILLETSNDKIEINENYITTLDALNDISNHGYVCVYKLEKNKINLEKNYTVYLNNIPKKPANDYAIIWAYLEALNIGNLKLARTFLSDELNNLLSDENIVGYFGDYCEMDKNWINDNQNIVWVIRNNKMAYGYIFEIEQQKIYNIDTI